MARIFISYRREDSDIWVSRLVDELRRHFPADQVFQDIASIDPGANFRDALEKALGSAAVMLAVIGRGWLSATDKQGRRRLDLAGDFVRLEVAESLRRPGVRVFPILVNGAEMPAEEDLPDPLKELHLRQAFELTVRHWHNDVAQLVQTLKRVTAPSEDPGAVQEAARQKAEDEARRREVEARAAQEEAERKAAEDQARKGAEEQARREAGEERRRVEEKARQKAAEEEARRKAEEEEAGRRAAQREAQRKRAEEEEALRKAEDEERRRVEEEARRKAVEEEGRRTAAQETQRKAAAEVAHETVARATPPVGPQDWVGRNWKLLAVVGVVIGAIALLLLGRRPDTESVRAPGVTQAPPAAARAPSRATSVVAGEIFRDCDQCPEMVVVPAGSFTMGSPRGEGSDDERPQHEVTIARAFAVGKYPITFDEWDACVAAGGCKYKPEDAGWGRSRRPAINVSWNDAQEYVAWLSKKTGKPYRLLSEAEWEYAARGGTTTRYPWGNDPGTNRANFYGSGSEWSGKQTAPVGSFDPNKFGLYDMIGNVWEWVEDCWNDSYKGAPRTLMPGSRYAACRCTVVLQTGGRRHQNHQQGRTPGPKAATRAPYRRTLDLLRSLPLYLPESVSA